MNTRRCVRRSAADHRGVSGLPEAGIPPHPQRQGHVGDRQGRSGLPHAGHFPWDVQTLNSAFLRVAAAAMTTWRPKNVTKCLQLTRVAKNICSVNLCGALIVVAGGSQVSKPAFSALV